MPSGTRSRDRLNLEGRVKQVFSVLGSPSLGQVLPRQPLHEIGVHDDGAHRAGAADR